MLACPLFREFHKLNKVLQVKCMNASTTLTSIGIVVWICQNEKLK